MTTISIISEFEIIPADIDDFFDRGSMELHLAFKSTFNKDSKNGKETQYIAYKLRSY